MVVSTDVVVAVMVECWYLSSIELLLYGCDDVMDAIVVEVAEVEASADVELLLGACACAYDALPVAMLLLAGM